MTSILRPTFIVIFGLLLLFISSCGGSSGSGSNNDTADDESQSGTPETISEFSKALSESMGEKGAFDGVVLSLDKGYTLNQIVDAGNTDRLGIDGSIMDGIGGVEIPENLPSDNFPKSINTDLRATNINRAKFDIVDLNSLRSRAKEYADELGLDHPQAATGSLGLSLIVILAAEGFSADEIIEGIFFGTITMRISEGILIDGKGPSGTPSELLTDDVTPSGTSNKPEPSHCPTFIGKADTREGHEGEFRDWHFNRLLMLDSDNADAGCVYFTPTKDASNLELFISYVPDTINNIHSGTGYSACGMSGSSVIQISPIGNSSRFIAMSTQRKVSVYGTPGNDLQRSKYEDFDFIISTMVNNLANDGIGEACP